MSGAFKMGVHSTGLVACAYTDGAGQIIVKVSTDYGATFATVKTVGALAARKDYSLIVDENGYIYLTHQVTTTAYKVERSINQGGAWTTQVASANYGPSGFYKMKMSYEAGVLFLFMEGRCPMKQVYCSSSWRALAR
jgi:hypothetical protein